MNAEPGARASAIIVAAGNSRRMGFDKLHAPLAGRPVLQHSIDAFNHCDAIDSILVVTAETNREIIWRWKADHGYHKLTGFVEGGVERHLSVQNGLQALPRETALVAVHDGARPLIRPEQISRCVAAARIHGAAACARLATETMKRANTEGFVSESIDRTGLWIMETPQVFDYRTIVDAYATVMNEELPVPDEVSAVQLAGVPVFLVENSEPNLKITRPADLQLAEAILTARASTE